MTRTHVWPHDDPKTTRNRKAANALRFRKLPLLGSNQDSSDPESEGRKGHTIDSRAGSRQITPDRDTTHTKDHTNRHPKPLALGGSLTWGGR